LLNSPLLASALIGPNSSISSTTNNARNRLPQKLLFAENPSPPPTEPCILSPVGKMPTTTTRVDHPSTGFADFPNAQPPILAPQAFSPSTTNYFYLLQQQQYWMNMAAVAAQQAALVSPYPVWPPSPAASFGMVPPTAIIGNNEQPQQSFMDFLHKVLPRPTNNGTV